jgi:hypothetical protein
MSTQLIIPTNTANLLRYTQTHSAPASITHLSHATQINNRLKGNSNKVLTLKQRWDDAMAACSKSQRAAYKQLLSAAKAEFKRRNPHLKKSSDLKLVIAHELPCLDIYVDDSMQRMLIMKWVLEIINDFLESMVMPIQVYKDATTGKYHAWDSQHTAIALWLIATEIFGEDPSTIKFPVNISQSTNKAQIRSNFVRHNGGKGKLRLDLIDIFIQMVLGVRLDGNNDPEWIKAEEKQQHLERYDLFVTAAKFNDTHLPGAITRLQEINKMSPESVRWLCRYLSKVGCDMRPAEEKEVTMMGQFFDQCYKSKIKVDDSYIDLLADTALILWNADFNENGLFWNKAGVAYKNWHKAMKIGLRSRFSKEPVHGMPFLMAQLQKSFALPIPSITTSSEFVPNQKDLF